MEVNLASNEAEISEKKDFITIVLKKDGNLLIKSKLFTISNINKEIKKNLKINPNYKIIIKCNKKAEVQKVVRLIEEIRLACTNKIKLVQQN